MYHVTWAELDFLKVITAFPKFHQLLKSSLLAPCSSLNYVPPTYPKFLSTSRKYPEVILTPSNCFNVHPRVHPTSPDVPEVPPFFWSTLFFHLYRSFLNFHEVTPTSPKLTNFRKVLQTSTKFPQLPQRSLNLPKVAPTSPKLPEVLTASQNFLQVPQLFRSSQKFL